jgi:hypothetical protein
MNTISSISEGKFSITGLIFSLYLLVSVGSQIGCTPKGNGSFTEGLIVYDVEYHNMEDGSAFLMPDEIRTYLAKGVSATVISGAMGAVETKIISDPDLKEYKTLISAMGQKIALVLGEEDVNRNFSNRVDLQLTHTGKEKIIAGYTCKEVRVRDSTDNVYMVYYSDDFGIEHPNWGTPFRGINGVLMQYSMKFGDSVLDLTAKRVEEAIVEPSFFEIPEDFQVITDPSQLEAFL